MIPIELSTVPALYVPTCSVELDVTVTSTLTPDLCSQFSRRGGKLDADTAKI